ncbi:MAG: TonB-dependent receptor, partial [Mucilaginibacter sp.]|nr:TonB-dependent receptor [Mucilaginibacter sp.]
MLFIGCAGLAQAQHKSVKDTLQLDSVIIKESRPKHLPNVSGTNIFAGKRTFDVFLDAGKANLAYN